MMTPRFGIDVGNSTTKLLRLPKGPPPENRTEFSKWASHCELRRGSFEEILNWIPKSAFVDLVSVDPIRSGELQRQLEDQGTVVWSWTSSNLPIANTYADDTTLGPDRPLAAYAAFAELRSAAVVVDAGTALTVDLVDDDGVFLGGAIAPGMQTIACALGDAGAMLHDTPARNLDFPGESTTDCLALGSFATFAGALQELVHRAKRKIPSAKVVVTGGDAKVVMEVLKENGPIERSLIPMALALLSWSHEENDD